MPITYPDFLRSQNQHQREKGYYGVNREAVGGLANIPPGYTSAAGAAGNLRKLRAGRRPQIRPIRNFCIDFRGESPSPPRTRPHSRLVRHLASESSALLYYTSLPFKRNYPSEGRIHSQQGIPTQLTVVCVMGRVYRLARQKVKHFCRIFSDYT